ncbi:MAG: type II toxin-antitoxin system Phd/YefM family antitoxin, partial [Ramlibacter sp.]
VSPEWLERSQQWDERRRARQGQKAVEQNRLMAHQRAGIALLSLPAPQRLRLLQAARREVRRWQNLQLCSQDYIDRWNEWLALPRVQLVERMCSDAGGWGNAMRQNSPFGALNP